MSHQIRNLPTAWLCPNSANCRTHPKKQICLIKRSIRQFGFTVPIIVDEKNVILAGHGRWLAAQQLGLQHVPAIVLSGLSEVEKRAYVLADNKLAEKAGYDRASLAIELSTLAPLHGEAGIDISLTGFEPAEIDALLGDLVDPAFDPVDEAVELAQSSLAAPAIYGS